MPQEIVQYIKIQYPLTLDKWWDASEPQAPTGLLQELENYIPREDYLETRKGITAFTFV